MRVPAILEDDVGLVNFTLVRDVDKSISVKFSTNPDILDITGWVFEVNFFPGKPAVKTKILSSDALPGGISVDAVDKSMILTFSVESVADVAAGKIPWDLRYVTAGGEPGQILKGLVTLGDL